jgi:hypothetical protein
MPITGGQDVRHSNAKSPFPVRPSLTPTLSALTLEDSRSKLNQYGNEDFPMAKLALIYGMRLFPEDELGEVTEATVTLKNGKTARVSMHLIDGSKEEIEETLRQSVAAFFEMYPEI